MIFLMKIWFPYPVFGFAFLPLLPVERLGHHVQKRVQEWRLRRAS